MLYKQFSFRGTKRYLSPKLSCFIRLKELRNYSAIWQLSWISFLLEWEGGSVTLFRERGSVKRQYSCGRTFEPPHPPLASCGVSHDLYTTGVCRFLPPVAFMEDNGPTALAMRGFVTFVSAWQPYSSGCATFASGWPHIWYSYATFIS